MADAAHQAPSGNPRSSRRPAAKADWYDPHVHPILESFCEHYGTVILPTKPYTPRHKGKVEKGIDYVQSNALEALKGRRFPSLAEQNRHLLDWETHVADTRIHGTTRKQVGKVFREVEQPALLPLPTGRFPIFHEAQRSVHRDGHVEVDKAYYSVPPEYVGRRAWVRWDGRLVRVLNQRMEQIAVHAQQEPGRFSTQPKHIDSRKISNVERGTTWLLGRASLIGPHTERWARAMLEARGIQGVRVLVGLVSLADRYRDAQIEQACESALTHNAFRLRAIRELIKAQSTLMLSRYSTQSVCLWASLALCSIACQSSLVLPDHFLSGAWTCFRERFPGDTHFVLASDGFCGAFQDPSGLWAWLKASKARLHDQDERKRLLRQLHTRLHERRGDDDISFVWVYPRDASGPRLGYDATKTKGNRSGRYVAGCGRRDGVGV